MTAVQQIATTDPNGPTGRLATWVADVTLDDVPREVVERAKHLLLDGIGCALIGSQLPWSRVAAGAVLDLENKGDVVVIGTGHSTSGPAAAVLNGTFIQGFELDDFHPIAPVHSCSLVIPALLSTAVARPEATSGADFLHPEDISKIAVTVGETIYKHGWWKPERPLTAIGAQMNIGYATAAALLDGNALPEQFTPARLDADDIWSLIDATDVHLDESLADAPLTERFRTDLTVTTRDGSVHHTRVVAPHGAPWDPVTNDELITKFHALADRVTSRDRADAIEQAVVGLEDLDDVSDLIDLLAPPVAGALD